MFFTLSGCYGEQMGFYGQKLEEIMPLTTQQNNNNDNDIENLNKY
jgi:hypothetical protein